MNNSKVPQDKLDELFKDEYAVFLLQGKNSAGNMIYSYIKVTLPNIKKLYAALNSGKDFSPGDFGIVVAEGEGIPSDELRAELANTYSSLQAISPATFPPTKSL